MGFNLPKQTKVEADAFVTGSEWTDAEDVWGQIHQAVRDYTHYDFEETPPVTYGMDKTFKISIVVEEV